VLAFLALFAGSAYAAEAQSPEPATGITSPKGATTNSYMVVAANPLAADAGAAIIKQGGNAIDAAIAVQLVLNMVEPQSSGIGGGAFLVYWDAKAKRLTTFDGRESAPATATPKRFLNPDGSPMEHMAALVGGRSVGVPGVLSMLELAHREHGKLPWPRVFAPALKIADEGFAISPRLHDLLQNDPALRNWEPAHSFFYLPDGSAKPVGAILKNPDLAQVLRGVARGGAAAFYKGRVAADIVRTVQNAPTNPGDLTEADIAGYQAIERPPLCGPYREYSVCGMGPPTSGGIGVIQTLGLLQRFDLSAMGDHSAQWTQLMGEATRLVMADRAAYIADPDAISVPTAALIDPGYLQSRSLLIDPNRHMPEVEPGKLPTKGADNRFPAASPEFPSTSHFSIVDRDGDIVAMTTSIENAFGSRLMVDGFLLNNTLTDFSYGEVAQGRVVANAVGPNKRPRSSMAPTIVFRGKNPVMVLGSPGGPAIPDFVVKTLVALIDWHMTPAAAAAAPNVISFGDALLIEPALADLKPQLEALGDQVRVVDFPSGIHAIAIEKGRLVGGADPRREGAVAGE
jgi:gamma-glutamyltranspeptidase/glutathione hydrolase